MVNIKIDGKSFCVPNGQNLVKAAKDNGIFIPSLCYFEHIDPPLGTCRTCTCKMDGKYFPACTMEAYEGLTVEVSTPELLDMRKSLVEMMFAEGNHFCPSCEKSGGCDLQHMAYELGISVTRFEHLFKDRLIDYRPKRIIMEHNRCIKCKRCVEDVRTDDGKKVFTYQGRGNETCVGIDYNEEPKLSESQAIAAMELCPTGAIIVRGVSMALPFGDREFDKQSEQHNFTRRFPKAPKPTGMEKKVLATASLAGCFGCHMSMLDIDLELLDLVELVTFNKSPLTDIKKFTGRCHIGLIEGGVCNDENIETLKEFRKMCDILVSVGECAVWGGLPAMRNTIPLSECLEEAYLNSATSEEGADVVPYHEDLPKILDKIYPCHDIVKIDYFIPGCPPSANHIWKSVKHLLWGDEYSILYSEFKYD